MQAVLLKALGVLSRELPDEVRAGHSFLRCAFILGISMRSQMAAVNTSLFPLVIPFVEANDPDNEKERATLCAAISCFPVVHNPDPQVKKAVR